jgi:hypothetical protein
MLTRTRFMEVPDMRNMRREEKQVFGYVIIRLEQYDNDGALQSRCYEVLCPRTAVVLGRQPSLRAAKRFVVMHELRDFSARGKHKRDATQMFAA